MNFEELYKAFAPLVFNLSLHYVQNKEDAEEITQDVFVAIHQSISNFKEESSHKTWIYRITINKCLDFQKSKQRKKRFATVLSIFKSDSVEIQYQGTDLAHPGAILEQKEAVNKIFEALNTLNKQQKTVIILHKIEGKTQKEIAEIMDISPKAVESLVQRAKHKLTQLLS